MHHVLLAVSDTACCALLYLVCGWWCIQCIVHHHSQLPHVVGLAVAWYVAWLLLPHCICDISSYSLFMVLVVQPVGGCG